MSTNSYPVIIYSIFTFQKSLKRVKIHDVGFNSPKHICARKPTCSIPETQELLQDVALPKPVEAQQGHKPRSNLTIVSGLKDLPPPPKTSVQFHNYWDTIKDNPQLCYRFLRVSTSYRTSSGGWSQIVSYNILCLL